MTDEKTTRKTRPYRRRLSVLNSRVIARSFVVQRCALSHFVSSEFCLRFVSFLQMAHRGSVRQALLVGRLRSCSNGIAPRDGESDMTALGPCALTPTPSAIAQELLKSARWPAQQPLDFVGDRLVPADPGQRVHGGHEPDGIPTDPRPRSRVAKRISPGWV